MIYFCGNGGHFSQFKSVSVGEILAYFKDHNALAVDTETAGRCWITKPIYTLQIGDPKNQFVIDCRTTPIKQFKELLERKTVIAHNVKFDYKFLKTAGIYLNNVYDTMLAEIVIWNGFDRRYGLDALHENYLNIELEKETRGDFHKLGDRPLTNRQILYAAKDVAKLHTLKHIQQQLIDKFDLQYAVDLENEVVKSFADIEYNGMYIDQSQWKEVAKNVSKQVKSQTETMDSYLIANNYLKATGEMDLFGEPVRQLKVNYDSPTQLKKLFTSMGLQHKFPDTNDRTLQKWKNDIEFVSHLINYRKIKKQQSTYGESFLDNVNKATGRIHTDFWQIKRTFRVGSSDPNMQNIPSRTAEFRACFKPRKGYKLVAIDYAGMELKIMVDFSDETRFIEALNRKEDPHCFAYNEMTGEHITPSDKSKRTKAKTVNFGKAYGMSPNKLQDQLDISLEEAEHMFEQHRKAFPKLNAWLDKQAKFGKSRGYIIVNPIHKGRRWFPEMKLPKDEQFRHLGSVERQSMNTPIQGTSAVAVKHSMSQIRKWLMDNGHYQTNVFMVLQVHDEIIFEIKDELVDSIVPELQSIMVEVGNKYVTKVNMDVDATISDHWKKG